MTDTVKVDEETFNKQKAFFKENLIKQLKEQGYDDICVQKAEDLFQYHGTNCNDMQSFVNELYSYLKNPGTRFIDPDTAPQLHDTEKFCIKYIEQTQDFVGDFSKLPFEQQKEIVKNSLIRNATQNGATRSTLNEINQMCDSYNNNEDIENIDSYLSRLYGWAKNKGPFFLDADADNSGFWPAKEFLENNLKPIMAYTNFPQAPEPEPVIEIDPKKKERIEQWMNSVGLGDKSDELIRAYGEQTYAVVQNAMANPADMAKLTDGTYRNSKNTLLYLLENKEAMKDKVSELQIVKTPKQPKEPVYRAPKFENTEMAKLNLNVSELEFPETIAIQPLSLNYGLSKEDADKVKFASAMKTALNKGIEGYYSEDVVQDACDKVFKACINDEKMNSDINEWSLAFTNKLVEELGISNDVDGDNDEFQKLTNPIFDVRYNIVSNLKNGTDLGIIDSNYVDQARTAQKEAVKRDMKKQEGEIVENADTIEKGEKVEKRLTFRERCKKGWDRVVVWFKGAKEEMVAYDEPTNEQQGKTSEFIEIAPVYSTTKHGSER